MNNGSVIVVGCDGIFSCLDYWRLSILIGCCCNSRLYNFSCQSERARAAAFKDLTLLVSLCCFDGNRIQMQAAQQPQGGGGRDTAIPFTHQRALIPASTIEFPTQRLYATSAFILLQALKLYDVYLVYTAHYPEEQSSKLLKWWAFDCLYLFVLWIMQIPWLQFSKFKTIALAILLATIDLFIFSIPSVCMLYGIMNM